MKNFYFPQIFQPVFGDNSLNNLTQWQNTSRRIQTQLELTKEETKTSKNINASKYNFFIHSTKFNKQKQGQQRCTVRNATSQTLNFQERQLKNNVMLECVDSIYLDDQQLNKQNKFKIKSHGKFYKQQRSLNFSTKSQAENQKKSSMRASTNVAKNEYLNDQNKQQQIKVRNSIKNGNDALKKKAKEQRQNDSKYLNNRLKTENLRNKKNGSNKVRFADQKEKSIHNTQKSIKSYKKIQSKSRKKIQSTKKIKIMKQLSGRRYGMETKQQIQFNLTDQMKKIIDSNKLLHSGKNNFSSSSNEYEQNDSDVTIQTSKKSFKQISIKDINSQRRKSRKNFTMHAFQNQQVIEKKQKKSYTIWDLKQSSSEQESQSKQSNGQKKLNENQKKKKKVHFGRTSIEQATGKSKKKISNGYITTKKSIKLKGIIQRFNGADSAVSIGDILAGQLPQAKKLFKSDKMQIKKPSKLRKLDTQNVYNELNYFRMRMNVSKKTQEQVVNNKPHPQAIIFSIQKVLHQLENQRIQRTRLNNMMIDFGVKITRACVLKQTGAREKIVNYAV